MIPLSQGRRSWAAWSLLVVACVWRPSQGAALDRAEIKRLVHQASALLGRGFEPPKAEREAAEAAMKRLAEHREAVTAYAVSRLQAVYQSAYPQDGELGAGQLGYVLWSLGPDAVRALEPDVLRSPHERVREAGVWILGRRWVQRGSKEAIALLTDVLRRDPSPKIQAEAVHGLSNHGATDKADLVEERLKSPHAVVREAAVQFFWSNSVPASHAAVAAMLPTEQDRGVGFWLSRTVARYEELRVADLRLRGRPSTSVRVARYREFRVADLLTSPRPGIRQGALFALGERRLTPEHWRPALALVDTETDPLCRMELGFLLAKRHRPECIPLLIEALKRQEPPGPARGYYTAFGTGARYSKAAASTVLANLVGLEGGGLTDDDRKRAREAGVDLYERVAQVYEDWWQQHRGRIRWSPERSRFVVAVEE